MGEYELDTNVYPTLVKKFKHDKAKSYWYTQQKKNKQVNN